MMELFLKGGPMMWPILLLSVIAGGTVIERLWFLFSERLRREPAMVETIFSLVEHGKSEEAVRAAQSSADPVAKVLVHGLKHQEVSLTNALIQASGRELDDYNRGLVVLDTAVTLGPLLGLLGTVIGMIRSFGILGGAELLAQQKVITGGIAESLIAVSFGLSVAIVAILPLNYLTSQMERMRRQLEDATTHLELLILKHQSPRS